MAVAGQLLLQEPVEPVVPVALVPAAPCNLAVAAAAAAYRPSVLVAATASQQWQQLPVAGLAV